MPMTGSYQDTDHVLGHELVHAFQYNIAQGRQGPGVGGLSRLPLWLIEGMAEYLSVGREDPLTAMWLRDAVRRDDIPTIQQLTRDNKYFPYRFGQALWAYIAGTYGDYAVADLYRSALRGGWEPSLNVIIGMNSDTLSARWADQIREDYLPLMEGRDAPSESGTLLLSPATGSGATNLAPSLSPDGSRLVFMSEKDLFSFDLFMADASTGDVIRTVSTSGTSPHFDALRFVDSSGAWSWDGNQLAFVVFADGNNEIVVVDSENGKVRDKIAVEGIGAMQGPAWSPDGNSLVFSGSKNAVTDLYLYDLATESTLQLTDDLNADFHPAFSPDGRTVAFATDRSPATDFEVLSYARFQLALLDVETGRVESLPVFGPSVKHINPQFSPDGRYLYFISDVDGFSDIYRIELATKQVERITKVATAVSGIAWAAPSMTVAQGTGEIAFSVFDEREFHVYSLSAEEVEERAEVVAITAPGPGRMLPPMEPRAASSVDQYLKDAETGLVSPGTFAVADAEEFDSQLALDFIGQPTIGVGTDAFGNYIGGGVSAYFSDMLGDRILGVSFSAQGSVKDMGGQVYYLNMKNRLNWGFAGGRLPYQYLQYGIGSTTDYIPGDTIVYEAQRRTRIAVNSATGILAYPFSMTQRVEGNLSVTRYGYDIEEDRLYYDQGRIIGQERVQLDQFEPDPLNLYQASIALVKDNSYVAFTSPVRGERYRFELETTHGSTSFQSILADYRRYFNPASSLTLAFRGLHYGRYNYSEDFQGNNFIQPFFLGYESLIRGYAWESYTQSECGNTSCTTVDRLYGQRIAVVSAEVRVPFIGTEQFGMINLPYVPMELVAFADGGVAWDDEREVEWEFSRSSTARVPLFSTGFSARMNILGILILEAYYAYPWQRPLKGWHWGFNMAPGW